MRWLTLAVVLGLAACFSTLSEAPGGAGSSTSRPASGTSTAGRSSGGGGSATTGGATGGAGTGSTSAPSGTAGNFTSTGAAASGGTGTAGCTGGGGGSSASMGCPPGGCITCGYACVPGGSPCCPPNVCGGDTDNPSCVSPNGPGFCGCQAEGASCLSDADCCLVDCNCGICAAAGALRDGGFSSGTSSTSGGTSGGTSGSTQEGDGGLCIDEFQCCSDSSSCCPGLVCQVACTPQTGCNQLHAGCAADGPCCRGFTCAPNLGCIPLPPGTCFQDAGPCAPGTICCPWYQNSNCQSADAGLFCPQGYDCVAPTDGGICPNQDFP